MAFERDLGRTGKMASVDPTVDPTEARRAHLPARNCLDCESGRQDTLRTFSGPCAETRRGHPLIATVRPCTVLIDFHVRPPDLWKG